MLNFDPLPPPSIYEMINLQDLEYFDSGWPSDRTLFREILYKLQQFNHRTTNVEVEESIADVNNF